MDKPDKIVKQLNALKRRFPKAPKVVRFVVEDGNDWMGQPALFIWVLLDSGSTREDLAIENLRAIDRTIFDELHTEDEPRWPFVRFRTEAEHAELTGV